MFPQIRTTTLVIMAVMTAVLMTFSLSVPAHAQTIDTSGGWESGVPIFGGEECLAPYQPAGSIKVWWVVQPPESYNTLPWVEADGTIGNRLLSVVTEGGHADRHCGNPDTGFSGTYTNIASNAQVPGAYHSDGEPVTGVRVLRSTWDGVNWQYEDAWETGQGQWPTYATTGPGQKSVQNHLYSALEPTPTETDTVTPTPTETPAAGTPSVTPTVTETPTATVQIGILTATPGPSWTPLPAPTSEPTDTPVPALQPAPCDLPTLSIHSRIVADPAPMQVVRSKTSLVEQFAIDQPVTGSRGEDSCGWVQLGANERRSSDISSTVFLRQASPNTRWDLGDQTVKIDGPATTYTWQASSSSARAPVQAADGTPAYDVTAQTTWSEVLDIRYDVEHEIQHHDCSSHLNADGSVGHTCHDTTSWESSGQHSRELVVRAWDDQGQIVNQQGIAIGEVVVNSYATGVSSKP